jgi:hypothetical protein
MLNRNKDGEYVGVSAVNDYKYRLYQLKDKSLYEWIQGADRTKCSKSAQKHFLSQQQEVSEGEDELRYALSILSYYVQPH